ncbi:putative phosphoribosyl transferase [Haloactinopolyspora alba]|uniref:Putative phosphoribosyl transferase n=1 Tax=Haloactinopolyspora alba TaxID=648780 RepID=A0A2P8DWD2_9ACTN|nr:phosphoribosyltransferase family protein [Haloactinopolyspora alba]PSL01533.1 putative phosphoribosyl transferase [Haloactinopolyspora alba]
MTFHDRDDAGRRLAQRLSHERFERPVVLALPRGGVPVAAHVAAALDAPLEVFVARKIGAPGQPEFGIGAIAEGGDDVVATPDADRVGVDENRLRELAVSEREELDRRVETYRGALALPELDDHDVILIDDGLATGITAEAALRSLRQRNPRRLVLAIPVCPPQSARRLARIADDVICIESHRGLGSIGSYYRDFSQISDDQVVELLAGARSRDVAITVTDDESVHGDLTMPAHPTGVVLFAHGSGSSRHSPRNRAVANTLREHGFATVLMDLLTENEAKQDATTRSLRFDIELLAGRLDLATAWLAQDPSTASLPLGYFGASTGAAAALVSAARAGGKVAAVVSRGGRPDLAGEALAEVSAPTLLIVGGLDDVVLTMNRRALEQLGGPGRVEIVEGASHLFEEPGTLDEVGRLAADWFSEHLD